jgi:hypothetical protein
MPNWGQNDGPIPYLMIRQRPSDGGASRGRKSPDAFTAHGACGLQSNNQNKRTPRLGFWIIAAAVMALVAYPLSFGPACVLVHQGVLPEAYAFRAYDPLFRIAESIGRLDVLTDYGGACMGDDGLDAGILILRRQISTTVKCESTAFK